MRQKEKPVRADALGRTKAASRMAKRRYRRLPRNPHGNWTTRLASSIPQGKLFAFWGFLRQHRAASNR